MLNGRPLATPVLAYPRWLTISTRSQALLMIRHYTLIMMDGKQVSDSWERGNPYEQYVGRWSRHVAPLFLSWLNLPVGRRWLDVGCGTGALSAAIVDLCSPASVAGVEPSEGFLKTARENLGDRVTLSRQPG